MAFSDDVIQKAWKRTGGDCECKRFEHNHANYRCSNALTFFSRGREGQGAWEAHHIEKSAGDTVDNCEILCWFCHRLSPEP